MYILWNNTLQNNQKPVSKITSIYMACRLQFCHLYWLIVNQLLHEKELLNIFHKINLKVNNLSYDWLKILNGII